MKLEGDDELLYLSSKNQLMRDCRSMILSENDIVIDSYGHSFLLYQTSDNKINLDRQNYCYTLTEITQLIRAHEFSKSEVCLSKIHFSSTIEAIRSLATDI